MLEVGRELQFITWHSDVDFEWKDRGELRWRKTVATESINVDGRHDIGKEAAISKKGKYKPLK